MTVDKLDFLPGHKTYTLAAIGLILNLAPIFGLTLLTADQLSEVNKVLGFGAAFTLRQAIGR